MTFTREAQAEVGGRVGQRHHAAAVGLRVAHVGRRGDGARLRARRKRQRVGAPVRIEHLESAQISARRLRILSASHMRLIAVKDSDNAIHAGLQRSSMNTPARRVPAAIAGAAGASQPRRCRRPLIAHASRTHHERLRTRH